MWVSSRPCWTVFPAIGYLKISTPYHCVLFHNVSLMKQLFCSRSKNQGGVADCCAHWTTLSGLYPVQSAQAGKCNTHWLCKEIPTAQLLSACFCVYVLCAHLDMCVRGCLHKANFFNRALSHLYGSRRFLKGLHKSQRSVWEHSHSHTIPYSPKENAYPNIPIRQKTEKRSLFLSQDFCQIGPGCFNTCNTREQPRKAFQQHENSSIYY